MVRVLMGFSPLPMRMPLRVVEPTPPFATLRVPKIELALNVDVALTAPCALVWRNPDGDPEIVRFVVEAVPKYTSPLAEIFVVLAPPLKICNCEYVFAVVVPKPREKMPVDELYWTGYVAE